MASYGIEMYADTGYKFVIPDYAGFVFSHYKDFTLPLKTWDNSVFHTQSIPAGAQAIVFIRVLGRNPSSSTNAPTVMYQKTGDQLKFSYIYYYPSGSSSDNVRVRLYFFYNKEATSDSTGYGLKIFDASGAVVFHTSSRPLRLSRANWGYVDGWSSNVGHNVAVLCNRLAQRGQVVQIPPSPVTHIFNAIPVGEGTTLKVGLSYQQTIPQPVSIKQNINPEILYINTSLYD